MKLSAPTKLVFWISLVVAILATASAVFGLINVGITIPFFTPHAFWVLFASYVLLLLGVTLKGL
jgi:hypothetical protein